ncbi:VOC family protein [Paenibacillus sp. sgz500958]|uniref:VOC family protein n=1 Tax=Paenibacillus sp. sgz500958 TaxID=3242475 RepID=UPI0036D34D0E
MDKGILSTQVITQIGIIVKDIEKTAKSYADFFGIPQPEAFWTDTQNLAQTELRGEATPARAKLAFVDAGQVQIELIQPDEQPSTWREFLDTQGEGIHHIAFAIKGMKEKIELLGQHGMPLIQKGEYTGGRYAYMDSFSELKVLVELLEND